MVLWINVCKCSTVTSIISAPLAQLIDLLRCSSLRDPIEIQDVRKRKTIHRRGDAPPSFCDPVEDEGDFRWDIRYTGYFRAQFPCARIVILLRDLFAGFSVMSSGIEKVSRWTSTRETLTVTDDWDASRSQDAPMILFDYLKSLARTSSL